jgi:hypothetical protein
VKEAVPVPLFVLVVNATVGFGDVDQQTPLAVIEPPPSFDIEPPDEAAEFVILVIELVDTVDGMGDRVVTVT